MVHCICWVPFHKEKTIIVGFPAKKKHFLKHSLVCFQEYLYLCILRHAIKNICVIAARSKRDGKENITKTRLKKEKCVNVHFLCKTTSWNDFRSCHLPDYFFLCQQVVTPISVPNGSRQLWISKVTRYLASSLGSQLSSLENSFNE